MEDKNWSKAEMQEKINQNKDNLKNSSISAVCLLILVISLPVLEEIYHMSPDVRRGLRLFITADIAVAIPLFVLKVRRLLGEIKSLEDKIADQNTSGGNEKRETLP